MPIETIRDDELDLTTHVVTGFACPEEMHETLANFHEETVSRLQLWDMSQADVGHVTPAILRPFVERAAVLGAAREDGRTAVWVSGDLQYGLGRMSQAIAEMNSASFEFGVFRSKEEAMVWLTR